MQGKKIQMYATTAEEGPWIKACRTSSCIKNEMALVNLMWFNSLHTFPSQLESAWSLCSASADRVPATFWGCPSPSLPPEFFHRYAPPQTGNMVLKQSCVSEKLSALEFQSILPLKCVQGAERKWVRGCAVPCFSEHSHYRGSAETERGT